MLQPIKQRVVLSAARRHTSDAVQKPGVDGMFVHGAFAAELHEDVGGLSSVFAPQDVVDRVRTATNAAARRDARACRPTTRFIARAIAYEGARVERRPS